ncbi:hypothetical protein KC19_2G209600 [Ceratodon purpureus]|uniref:DUF7748 domain-containing protein n=1 Tax=Ceratodon purpureus TaxID=3225 RepID=A0A8T0IZ65_CERPU|nr:hypothetical protein KC19_2G209600 [Ceratodon purpureus]
MASCKQHPRLSSVARFWYLIQGKTSCYVYNGTDEDIDLSCMTPIGITEHVTTIPAGKGHRIMKDGDTYLEHWATLQSLNSNRCISSDHVKDYECLHVKIDSKGTGIEIGIGRTR